NCSMQKKGDIPNRLRKSKLCESTPVSKIDFAYKVRVDGRKDSGTTDVYSMRVVQVIKEGTSDVGPLDKDRLFLSYPRCRVALGLQVNKTFLIMGPSRDISRDDKTYQYVLGEGSWIEYWPTGAECQTQEHRLTCLGIEDMAQEYTFFGCQLK
ncbi:complement C3-like, partial [Scomber scombrus]